LPKIQLTKFARRLRAWLPELLVFALVFGGVHLYRTADMLDASGEPAPSLYLPVLGGGQASIPAAGQQTTLVYFFAPWCTWCAASAHNIRNLRKIRGEDELTIFLVALSYEAVEEVQGWVDRHDIDAVVLLGTNNTAREWGVSVFPTYYIVDGGGRVAHRDYGYSTLAGLWFRTSLAG